MISVEAAKKIIEKNKIALAVEKKSLEQAAHHRLSEDIFSLADMPAYPQSSMDGYAFAYADWKENNLLFIEGKMQAGSKENFTLRTGQAARIFTGAPLPEGADTVIMQEKAQIAGNQLKIADQSLQAGNSVRPVGSVIKAGELALVKNSLLTPAALGFLAGMGFTELPVFAKPAVSIIVTGNELQQPGTPLQYGEVYESNSYTLKAALQQVQINRVSIYRVDDKLELVVRVMQKALLNSDMVLLTGGVSVGDYDFVVQAAEACGVRQLFHKIKQRPGKPLYVGSKNNKLVFGLPGNPSSVLTCFYEYVLPALNAELLSIQVPLAESVKKQAGLTHFLKAYYNGVAVLPLDAQESFRMSSFATANCLIKLDEETILCDAGELTEIHLLPM